METIMAFHSRMKPATPHIRVAEYVGRSAKEVSDRDRKNKN
jgi:hypothetical protein